jgi:hypothetical protein
VQYEALRAGLAGEKQLNAQLRLVFELVRRGRLKAEDLVALANRERRQP